MEHSKTTPTRIDTAQPIEPLDYATPRVDRPNQASAWPFATSGLVALICVSAMPFLHGHDDWKAFLFITAFGACLTCVVSASNYRRESRKSADIAAPANPGTRTLATVAIALAVGFLIVIATFVVVVILFVFSRKGPPL